MSQGEFSNIKKQSFVADKNYLFLIQYIEGPGQVLVQSGKSAGEIRLKVTFETLKGVDIIIKVD